MQPNPQPLQVTPGSFALSLLRAEYRNEPIDALRTATWDRIFATVSLADVETAVLDFLTDPTARGFFPHPGEVLARIPRRRSASVVIESTIARYCRMVDAIDAGDQVDPLVFAMTEREVGTVMVSRLREFRAAHPTATGR